MSLGDRIESSRALTYGSCATFYVPAEFRSTEWAHEHVTLRIGPVGGLTILSRDEEKAVCPFWHSIGTFDVLATGHRLFTFNTQNFAISLIASWLQRMGAVIQGIPTVAHRHYFEHVEALESDGRTTNPDTLLGTARADRVHRQCARKRATVQRKFGRIGQTDIAAMRAAIEERRKARKAR